jgi:MFS family permease
MLIGLLVLAVSVLALAFPWGVIQLVLLRVLAGAGGALFNISRHVYMTEAIPRKNRGRAIALFGGTNRFGDFAGPAVGGVVAASFGLESPFVLYALLTGLTFALCWLFVERQESRSRAAGHSSQLAGLTTVIRDSSKVLLTAGSAQVLAQIIRVGRRVLIPLFAANVLHLEIESVGLIVSIAAAFDLALIIPAGMLMDRYGRKFAIVPSFLIQALSLALVPLTGGFTSLLAVACIGGIGNGIGSGTMITLGADLAPRRNIGAFLGIWRLIADIGSAGGPLIAGAVAQSLGLGQAAGVVAVLGAAAGLMFARFVPETLKFSAQHEASQAEPAD